MFAPGAGLDGSVAWATAVCAVRRLNGIYATFQAIPD